MQSVVLQLPRGLIITSLWVVTVWGISQAGPFLIPICISALLAFMVAPFVRWVRRHGFPEWAAILASAGLLVLPFLGLLSLVFWQGQSLVHDFPLIMDGVNQAFESLVTSDLGKRLSFSELSAEQFAQKLEGIIGRGVQLVISGIGTVLGAGADAALILLFAVLMLASRNHLERCAKKLLKNVLPRKSPDLLSQVIILIEKFLVARLVIVLIVGAMDSTVLHIMGYKYSFILGAFLGIMTIVPAVGFMIGLTPPILVALATGHTLANGTVMVSILAVVSLIEGNVLTPRMVGRSLNINALSTFIGLFAGSLIWGMWGMLLSVPILGILRICLLAAPSLRPWGELLAEKKFLAPDELSHDFSQDKAA